MLKPCQWSVTRHLGVKPAALDSRRCVVLREGEAKVEVEGTVPPEGSWHDHEQHRGLRERMIPGSDAKSHPAHATQSEHAHICVMPQAKTSSAPSKTCVEV